MIINIEDLKEDLIKFILSEDECNENGDLVIGNRGGQEEIIPKEQVKEMINNCKSLEEIKQLVMVKFEVGEAMSFGDVLEELIDN